MEAFLVSAGVVALAEMGDKTQLLSITLAARFKRPVPIVLGILAATLLNHFCAGAVGAWVAQLVGPRVMRWVLGGSFLAMAAWVLVPDKLDDDAVPAASARGIFMTTVVSFFLAEMGDKTQIATVALAARFHDLASVVAGTTFGMMLASVPAVFLSERLVRRVPIRLVHGIAAALFAALGVAALLGVGG